MNLSKVFLLVLLAPATLTAATVKLTADDAARRLVEVSHVAAAAAERYSAADSSIRSADAARYPLVSLSAHVSERSSVPEFRLPLQMPPGEEAPLLFPDITETYAAWARAQQIVYAGGAITALRRAAQHDKATVAADQDRTSADLKLTARSAYWDAVQAGASLEAAISQEKRALQLVSDTRATFEAGLSVRADVLASEERAAGARVQVIRATAAAANAMAQLRSLLAIPPADTIELASLLSEPLPPVDLDATALENEAMARRPETRILQSQREALHQREHVAASASKPNVSASAQYDYSRPNSRYFPLQDEWKGSWAIGLSASINVFDGGKWRADVATSRASQRALDQDLEELKRRIQLEVDMGLRNLAASVAAVAATDAAHATAVENEKAALERREAGLAALIEVLDAQSQLASAEQEMVRARATAWISAARLDRALGR